VQPDAPVLWGKAPQKGKAFLREGCDSRRKKNKRGKRYTGKNKGNPPPLEVVGYFTENITGEEGELRKRKEQTKRRTIFQGEGPI